MRSCSGWRLYVIVDSAAIGRRDPAEVASAAIRGGADVLQLRDKSASTRQLLDMAARLLPHTRSAGIPLVINDRVDVAVAVGADGVHLGQDDLPVEAARGLLGPERLIGKSTHSVEQATTAESEGVDYIGFGPIFPTPTKPDYQGVGLDLLRQAARDIHVPMVCIGGIDISNLETVVNAGAERVAVVRAVCAAADPEAAARALKHRLEQLIRPRVPSSL